MGNDMEKMRNHDSLTPSPRSLGEGWGEGRLLRLCQLALLAVAATVISPALAQDEAEGPARYASVSSLNWEIEGGDVAKGSGVRLVLGQQLSDVLSLEVHAGLGGGSSAEIDYLPPGGGPEETGPADIRLKQLLGGYLRAEYPVTQQLTVFGLAGYTTGKLDIEVQGPVGAPRFSESDRGGSYGAGLEFDVFTRTLDGRLRLTADYMVYLDRSDARFVARSVGMRLAF